jgi:hypothetical protein
MPSRKFSSTFLATVFFSLLLVASVGAQSLSGSVIAVADGDTISLRTDAVPPGDPTPGRSRAAQYYRFALNCTRSERI